MAAVEISIKVSVKVDERLGGAEPGVDGLSLSECDTGRMTPSSGLSLVALHRFRHIQAVG